MAVERRDLYDEVSKQLPRGVFESTRITATKLASLGKVNAADFFAALDDSRIILSSKGIRNEELEMAKQDFFIVCIFLADQDRTVNTIPLFLFAGFWSRSGSRLSKPI